MDNEFLRLYVLTRGGLFEVVLGLFLCSLLGGTFRGSASLFLGRFLLSLGNPAKLRELKQLLTANNPDLIFLSETKMSANDFCRVQNKCRMQNGLAVNSEGWSGGLALMWRDGMNVSIQNYSKHHIDLMRVRESVREEWIVGGDFNAILNDAEKEGGHRGDYPNDKRLYLKFDACWEGDEEAKNVIERAWNRGATDFGEKIERDYGGSSEVPALGGGDFCRVRPPAQCPDGGQPPIAKQFHSDLGQQPGPSVMLANKPGFVGQQFQPTGPTDLHSVPEARYVSQQSPGSPVVNCASGADQSMTSTMYVPLVRCVSMDSVMPSCPLAGSTSEVDTPPTTCCLPTGVPDTSPTGDSAVSHSGSSGSSSVPTIPEVSLPVCYGNTHAMVTRSNAGCYSVKVLSRAVTKALCYEYQS
ncbi:hypothetical protein GOBAR_AA03573 [Gossypium barbadense]|uniref:Endonuclease/exonuclease/phosphatase domain-containing protein n=1 Tax=Gossypium barbadense TaxID=3634 RepID=A0A2P5YN26_GOSBA|nr:hypothetical protein GOBAR_AA03573 [Gossypium barbadense]